MMIWLIWYGRLMARQIPPISTTGMGGHPTMIGAHHFPDISIQTQAVRMHTTDLLISITMALLIFCMPMTQMERRHISIPGERGHMIQAGRCLLRLHFSFSITEYGQ